ncbi:MAG: S-layer homology domain-containing protein [Firmicutes bacterium]|nr:S-layer homology domain-containing protein [Bacillota bacterium]
MKKLTGLLAAVLVFAFSATSALAATYTDAADQANVAVDAAAKLTALGITEGYEDGSFGFENTITRAEFAKMAVIASGAESTATMLEGSKPSFKDVKAGAWYTGWINAAESLNLVQGDGNGTFRPNDTISNQEVITVLMRMLGYNDNLPGAWPTNYVTEANKKDVLDDVSIVAAAAAKRGDVAVMVSNTLDTELVTYDKDTDEFVLKQTTKSDSEYVTLLDDAFDGTYVDIHSFEAVDQVRDAAKQQLNWNLGTVIDKDGDEVDYDGKAMIIDADTRVSVNGGSLFDLAGHQGKVYFVKDGDKQYARFIEVESYAVAVGGDKPAMDGKKLEANNKTYSVAPGFDYDEDVTATSGKNSKWKLFFNDDDQVYAVASDKDDTRKAYFVESVGNSIKLTGNTTENVSMEDDETLIWNGTEYVAPSTLEVGDALIEVTPDELYVLTEAKTGVVKSSTSAKVNIDGTNYAGKDDAQVLDAEYEDAGVTWDEVYNNTVTYLLNKDNSLSAVIVDEVSTGTKLYGVVVGGNEDDDTNWGSSTERKVTIFTEEGTTVEYDVDEDKVNKDMLNVNLVGQLVEYKLNKDGEIKALTTATNDLYDGDEIEVKNNAYLVGAKNLTLATNVAVFEISEDEDDIDVALVTRAALLGGGDFDPQPVTFADIEVSDGKALEIKASAKYFVNTNGTARALAYTDAESTKYHYGVVDAMKLDLDGDTDENGNAIYNDMRLVGDETEYEYTVAEGVTVDDDYAIMYTVSGDDINIVAALSNEPGKGNDEHNYYVQVKSFTDGLLVTEDDVWVTKYLTNPEQTGVEMNNIMTDANTLVCVITDDGEAIEGTLDDISKNAWVYVPTVDDDDYADIIIVNEYTDYNKIVDTPTTQA